MTFAVTYFKLRFMWLQRVKFYLRALPDSGEVLKIRFIPATKGVIRFLLVTPKARIIDSNAQRFSIQRPRVRFSFK